MNGESKIQNDALHLCSFMLYYCHGTKKRRDSDEQFGMNEDDFCQKRDTNLQHFFREK